MISLDRWQSTQFTSISEQIGSAFKWQISKCKPERDNRNEMREKQRKIKTVPFAVNLCVWCLVFAMRSFSSHFERHIKRSVDANNWIRKSDRWRAIRTKTEEKVGSFQWPYASCRCRQIPFFGSMRFFVQPKCNAFSVPKSMHTHRDGCLCVCVSVCARPFVSIVERT